MLQHLKKLSAISLALLASSGCGIEVSEITNIGLPPPPVSESIQVELAEGSLGALDFLTISGCAVQVTLGKHNSNLGRRASPSQRLLLELEYLLLAPECIDYQRKQRKEELAATLETAWQLKRAQLPTRIYNATLAGPEYRQFWRSKREAGGYPKVDSGQVLQSLMDINALARRWLGGDYRADNRAFEIRLSEVAGGDGGKLITALDRRYYTLLEAINELETLVRTGAHPDFLEWQQARDNLLADLHPTK
jgi:hypothetical protein